jgi:glucuronate isomerase
MWLDFAFQDLFGLDRSDCRKRPPICTSTRSRKSCARRSFLPRALYERFHFEVLATTDSPLDSLADHKAIRDSNWKARITPDVSARPGCRSRVCGICREYCEARREDQGRYVKLGGLSECALRVTRLRFRELGCTATDHGHPTARTANLPVREAAELFRRVARADADAQQQELFRAQMLTEMARMSLEDGLVMQIHPGQRAQPQSQPLRALRPRRGRGYSDADKLCGRASPFARSVRQRAQTYDHSFHAGRIDLQPRIGAAGRALSMLAARARRGGFMTVRKG